MIARIPKLRLSVQSQLPRPLPRFYANYPGASLSFYHFFPQRYKPHFRPTKTSSNQNPLQRKPRERERETKVPTTTSLSLKFLSLPHCFLFVFISIHIISVSRQFIIRQGITSLFVYPFLISICFSHFASVLFRFFVKPLHFV